MPLFSWFGRRNGDKLVDSKNEKEEEIVVIGAGIIGLTTAYRLAQNGYKNVTVIDKSHYSGQFCSHGNAGRIIGNGSLESQYSSKSSICNPDGTGRGILFTICHSFMNHIPYYNTLNDIDSNFTIDPRFFFNFRSYQWGFLYFKRRYMDEYLSSKLMNIRYKYYINKHSILNKTIKFENELCQKTLNFMTNTIDNYINNGRIFTKLNTSLNELNKKLTQYNLINIPFTFTISTKKLHEYIIDCEKHNKIESNFYDNKQISDHSQCKELNKKWQDYCFNQINDILSNNNDKFLTKCMNKYKFQIQKQHWNVMTSMENNINTKENENVNPFLFMQNNLDTLKNASSSSNNGDTNSAENLKITSFVPNRDDFIRYEWTSNNKNPGTEKEIIEVNPTSFVANCGQLCKILQSGCEELGVTFRMNTQVSKIIVSSPNNNDDNGDKGKKKIKVKNNMRKIQGIYTDDGQLISCNKLIICAGIMTNDLINKQIYQSLESKESLQFLPFIPIMPLQGFSLTMKYGDDGDVNYYKYPSGSQVFYPNFMEVTHFEDGNKNGGFGGIGGIGNRSGNGGSGDVLRFSKLGYLRPIWYSTNKWYNWNDLPHTKSKDDVSHMDTNYIVSNVNQDELTWFESKLVKNFVNSIENVYLPLYCKNSSANNNAKEMSLWTNWRPLTPDRVPIVSKINEIDGLYINAGHGTKGLNLSFGSATLISKMIENEDNLNQTEKGLKQLLSLDRFRNRVYFL